MYGTVRYGMVFRIGHRNHIVEIYFLSSVKRLLIGTVRYVFAYMTQELLSEWNKMQVMIEKMRIYLT
jgi:hypothetical protein